MPDPTPKPTAELPDHHLLKHDAAVRAKAFEGAAELVKSILIECRARKKNYHSIANYAQAEKEVVRCAAIANVLEQVRALAKE